MAQHTTPAVAGMSGHHTKLGTSHPGAAWVRAPQRHPARRMPRHHTHTNGDVCELQLLPRRMSRGRVVSPAASTPHSRRARTHTPHTHITIVIVGGPGGGGNLAIQNGARVRNTLGNSRRHHRHNRDAATALATALACLAPAALEAAPAEDDARTRTHGPRRVYVGTPLHNATRLAATASVCRTTSEAPHHWPRFPHAMAVFHMSGNSVMRPTC